MKLSDRQKNFLVSELDNWCENVRNGNIDPSTAFPPTLSYVVDTLNQADVEFVYNAFGFRQGDEDDDASIVYELIDLAAKAVANPDVLIADVIE